MNLLENKDIKLRALEPSDISILFEWENNFLIWEVSSTLVPFSKYVLKKYIESSHLDIYESKQLRLVISDKETDKPLGLIDMFDFDPFHRRAGIGILVNNEEDRGKGIASSALECFINYAFRFFKIHNLYCNVPSDNIGSIKLFEKFGFQRVGIKKSWIRTVKGWKDEYMYQLVNE